MAIKVSSRDHIPHSFLMRACPITHAQGQGGGLVGSEVPELKLGSEVPELKLGSGEPCRHRH
jgi:hypothetical protein